MAGLGAFLFARHFIIEDFLFGHNPSFSALLLAFRLRILLSQLFFSSTLYRHGAAVPAGTFASVGDVKPPVNPYEDVEPHDNDFNAGVEDPETRFALIGGRMLDGARVLERCRSSECRTKTEEEGRGEEDIDLGSPAAGAKFFNTRLSWDEKAESDDWNW